LEIKNIVKMNLAIIVAGGKGKRMHKRINKLFLLLNKEPIIFHTLNTFQNCKNINKIILVIRPEDRSKFESIIKSNKFDKVIKVVDGGAERQDSVYNGIKAIDDAKDDDVVLIHNAVNPFVDEATINNCINATKKYGAAVVGFPAKDTIKVVDSGFVKQTIDRRLLWQVQTPQAMKYFLAKKAFERAYKDKFYGTDDASLVEKIGGSVKIVYCPRENIKITDPHDLAYANKLTNATRIGIGQDSHKFSTDKNKKLMLGGLEIENKSGFEANSDGDVLLHALFNALSTTIGYKSISFYADDMCKRGITDSKKYVEFILDKVNEKGFKISNVAVMLEGKKPRIDEYIDKIKASLSKLLKIKKENIGIAATSGEELTEFGKGRGMQCFAVVTLKS
jgi:2-C-methyl-D-erythritol 4-phosphate cytidylyltransferase/2-C-methyl-D-erythritol 2,4-cyclodiphosphate synthase|tara:strand:+ start:22985 stop:24160 length:1176 start_codon:yes stop_codon:yes gene_type:complete